MATLLDLAPRRVEFLSRKLPLWFLTTFALLVVLSFVRPPAMPAAGNEPSWVLATEYAFRHHLAYGTEFVFTYGPFGFLSTRLFQTATFPFVILSDVFLAVVYLTPLLIARDLWLFILYLVPCLVGFFPPDAVVSAAILSLFGLTLAYRNLATIAAAAGFAALALSKYSFLLVAVPLFLLSDAYHFSQRKLLPAFFLIFSAAFLLLIEIVSPGSFSSGKFIQNTYDIITYYSRAMQFDGSALKMGLYAVAATAFILVVLVSAYQNPGLTTRQRGLLLTITAGIFWYIFVVFKMGYVRQDDHIADSWHALIFGFVIVLATLRILKLFQPAGALSVAAVVSTLLGFVVCSSALVDMRQTVGGASLAGVPAYVASRFQQAADSMSSGLSWIYPARWRDAAATREAAEAAIRRSFPPSVTGTVDVIPGDVAPVIVSGLRYQPRPVLESYSSYSSRLQQLDRAYFASPYAPDTLFLDLDDIDGRLPMLATGPSLPVIARRYDAIDLDPLGVILRRRVEPRSMTETGLGQAEIRLGDWVALPNYGHGLLFATFAWPRSLFGKALAFLFREPVLTITLKSISGHEYVYRFVPSMTEAGVVLAPLPVGDGRLEALELLDQGISGNRLQHITAFRISGGRFARWTYPLDRVSFRKLDLAPGFSGPNASMSLLRSLYDTATNEQVAAGAIWISGHDLFAHAPAKLAARVTAHSVLRGTIGFADDPLVRKNSEGVRFIVDFAAQGDVTRRLLDKTLVPRRGPDYAGPVPFSVEIPEPGEIYLDTEPVGSTSYDWSMWRGLTIGQESPPRQSLPK